MKKEAKRIIDRCVSYNKLIAITGIVVETLLIVAKAQPELLIAGVTPILVALCNIVLLKLYDFRGILVQYKSSRTYKLRHQKSNKLQSINQR